MKKLFTLAIVALMAVSASAQYYLGGSVGFDMDSNKPEGGEKSTNTRFTIAPEFGYNLNENMTLGISVGFTNSKTEINTPETKENNFFIAPYFRYYFFDFGKFRVAAQATADFNTGKRTTTTGGVDFERKTTGFGLNIAPMLTYGLTDKVTLLAGLNFMNLGFNQEKVKDLETNTDFGFGVNTNNVTNTGNIQIGFVYNF